MQLIYDMLQVSNGEFQVGIMKINLNNLCVLVQNIEEVFKKVYLDISDNTKGT